MRSGCSSTPVVGDEEQGPGRGHQQRDERCDNRDRDGRSRHLEGWAERIEQIDDEEAGEGVERAGQVGDDAPRLSQGHPSSHPHRPDDDCESVAEYDGLLGDAIENRRTEVQEIGVDEQAADQARDHDVDHRRGHRLGVGGAHRASSLRVLRTAARSALMVGD